MIMKNWTKNITLTALFTLGLVGCTDFQVEQEKLFIAQDLDTVANGLRYFHVLNKEESCPSVSRLIADGFINHNPDEFGSLKRSQSLYKIKSSDHNQCEISVVYGDLVQCDSSGFPGSIVAICEKPNTLALKITTNRNL